MANIQLYGFLSLLLSTTVFAQEPVEEVNPAEPVETLSAGALAQDSGQILQATTGQRITVPAGANLQSYLDLAKPGDTLVLTAGSTYRGNFVLRDKFGDDYITITTSRSAELPAAGYRVKPSHAPLMAKIEAPNSAPALDAAAGAHHYKLVGLELAPAAGVYNNGLLRVGTGTETSLSQLPHDFIIDRMYIHGDPAAGSKRGVALNGIDVTVQNSWISDFKSTWQDTQAVCGWNGPGPFTVMNNFLEASGENVFFAEGSRIPGVYPSDILIRKNHLSKPLIWRTFITPGGSKWLVKNLLELKSGKRVVIDGNILENNWLAGQVGFAINVKAGTDALSNRAITDGVTITNNIIRNAAGGIIIGGSNGEGGYAANITIRNNLFDNINVSWGGNNHLFVLAPNANGVVIENNTATSTVTGKGILGVEKGTASGFIFRSNIAIHATYGVKGAAAGVGTSTLNTFFPGHLFANNVIVHPKNLASSYPPVNFFVDAYSALGMGSNYTLSSTSPYKGKGFNGKDPGANYSAISVWTSKVISGVL